MNFILYNVLSYLFIIVFIMQHQQIIIVGGGPVGLTCALLLAQQKISVTILEPSTSYDSVADARVLALSYASIALLRELNICIDGLATPISQVHISHSGLGVSNILANDVDLPYLGYTIKYTYICAKLRYAASQSKYIKWHDGVVTDVTTGKHFASIVYTDKDNNVNYATAELVIMAQGGGIKIKDLIYKEYDYKQLAVTAEIITQKQHRNIAYERFDRAGASVMLPHGNNFILVWSLPIDAAQEILQQNNLIERLKNLSGMKKFGRLELNGRVAAFPLKLQVAQQKILGRVVLIGNSAQTIHPISAQGMNIALRDALILSDLVVKNLMINDSMATNLVSEADEINQNDDLCWNNLNIDGLSAFTQLRQADTDFVTGFTHRLAKMFSKHITGTSPLKGLGLVAIGNCKPMQNLIANSLIFGR